jgi:pimeloyl-ACP methyl ester carboxylesterase
MSRHPRNAIRDLRGAARLAVVGGTAATDVVEAVHTAITGKRPNRARRPVSPLIYHSIRQITRIAGDGIDRTLAPLEVRVADNSPGTRRAALIATLNGVVGDHLAETGNPLAITMRFCRAGEPLVLDAASLRTVIPDAGGRILVLVHGLCGNDRDWLREGHDHGEALARDLGYTPIYLHYNAGKHISENGREFSSLLEQLVQAWPVQVEDIVLLGHSMGGLVARSACHYGEQPPAGTWRSKLTKLVCLGTPHHGAPLERGGNRLQVLAGVNRYIAPLGRLGRLRSAGITDLRYGAFLDEHWSGRDRFEPGGDTREVVDLPTGVTCYALAGTMSIRGRRHPLGDGLVTVASALGHHRDPRRALDFPTENTHLVTETGHMELLSNPEVYRTLKSWLAAPE